jgi:LPS O-antigen subunit length determinant protein (WzzB/FepE family)
MSNNQIPREALSNASNGSDESEISLIDILQFLNGAYKTILMFGVLGVAAAIAYLVITPKKYEAIAQIAMAQIGAANNNNNNNNNNINPLGINIEEPSLLIARMSSPTSFTPQVIAACGLQDQANPALTLSKSIKLSLPKGVANVVELKTFGLSPQAAEQCNLAIFELIKTTQSLIVAPFIAEAKVQLDDDIERLAKAKALLAKVDKSGSAMGAVYLSTRDEIRYLLDEITALKNVVTSNQNRATRLVSPIYAGDIPISPKKPNILAAGLFGGLFLGLLIAMGRRVIRKLKNEAVSVC